MPSENTEPLLNPRRLEHLDPSVGHVPVEMFNRLVDVVNSLGDSVQNLIAVIAAELADGD